MPLDDDLNKQGYNKEEAYFYALNKALIEKKKKKRTSPEGKCPQCGTVLEALETAGVRAMRCKNCTGIFLPKEALEFLLGAKETQQFISALLRLPDDPH